jgi:hypothetical protein
MAYGKTEEILYFTTPKGLVAVSLDEGETIVLPSGKTMKPTEVWEEASTDLIDKLTPIQRAALDTFRAAPEMTDLERMAWDLHKGTLKAAKHYAPRDSKPETPDVSLGALVVESDPED